MPEHAFLFDKEIERTQENAFTRPFPRTQSILRFGPKKCSLCRNTFFQSQKNQAFFLFDVQKYIDRQDSIERPARPSPPRHGRSGTSCGRWPPCPSALSSASSLFSSSAPEPAPLMASGFGGWGGGLIHGSTSPSPQQKNTDMMEPRLLHTQQWTC